MLPFAYFHPTSRAAKLNSQLLLRGAYTSNELDVKEVQLDCVVVRLERGRKVAMRKFRQALMNVDRIQTLGLRIPTKNGINARAAMIARCLQRRL